MGKVDSTRLFSLVTDSWLLYLSMQTIMKFCLPPHLHVYDIQCYSQAKSSARIYFTCYDQIIDHNKIIDYKSTHHNLITVTKKIKKTSRYTSLAIFTFEWQIQTVVVHTPYLYVQCLQFRLQLKALIITDGMTIFWIIISPVDQRNLLVIRLIWVELDLRSDIASIFVRKTAIMNPVAVVKFFYIICKGVLLYLLKNKKWDGGLLGPVSTYFSLVKTNGCGMLYLHCLV